MTPDSAIAFQIGYFTVRWYGVLMSLAMAVGVILAYREAKRQHLDVNDLLNLCLLILPFAVVGARLYYVLCNLSYYSQNPVLIFKTWTGGMAIHGGIIAALIVSLIYCHKHKLKFLLWADLLVPSLVLGQAIGRWGNFFNQEAYGYVTTVPWAMYIDGAYRHPTFLYESLWDVGVFFVLMILIRKKHKIGSIFASYLVFYSIGRFFVEYFRTDSLMFGPFSAAMVVSGLGVVAGVILLRLLKNKPAVDVAKAIPVTKSTASHIKKNKSKKQKK